MKRESNVAFNSPDYRKRMGKGGIGWTLSSYHNGFSVNGKITSSNSIYVDPKIKTAFIKRIKRYKH